MPLTEIAFAVPGEPIPLPRQQQRIVWPSRADFAVLMAEASSSGVLLEMIRRKTFVQNYMPAKHPIHIYKRRLQVAAKARYWDPPLDCPLLVDLIFVFGRPSGMVWKTKPMPRVLHAKRPDRDNCEKAVMDALNGILWQDDSRVCLGSVEKWIAGGDEQPHTQIRVMKVGE